MVLLIWFWYDFGILLGVILGRFEVMLRSKIGLQVSWTLQSSQTWISTVRLRPFWKVLGDFWGGFWRYFCIFCRYRFHYKSLYDFKMIFDGFWYHLDKKKWAKSMEDSAKMNFACCLLSNGYGHWFWTDFGFPVGAISRPNSLSEATSKASVTKYANQEGSESIDNPL